MNSRAKTETNGGSASVTGREEDKLGDLSHQSHPCLLHMLFILLNTPCISFYTNNQFSSTILGIFLKSQ